MEPDVVLTPEEQAAIDRVDGVVPNVMDGYNPDGTPKEELIAGKFKSQDDLLNAYKELEKKLGQPKEVVPDTKPTPDTPVVPDEVKGLITPDDFTSFSKEYNETGTLTEDTYKALETKGLSKQVVDAYIEGQKALADNKAQKLLNYVGGADAYNGLITWAKANYNPEQASAFDTALFSGNEASVQEQIDLLNYRMSKAGTVRIDGTSSSGNGGLKPFASKSEWQAAVSHAHYGRDAAYTKMVDGRYLRSLDAKTL